MNCRLHRLGLRLAAAALCGLGAAGAAEPQGVPMKSKSLVVYYSWSGKTELAAKTLAAMIGAELLPIEDVAKPSSAQAYGEGRAASLEGKSWPVKPFHTDVSGFDRIFVGCPVWFGMPPPEFNAAVEQVDFQGKPVVVFVTLGGGSPDKALQVMTDKVTARGGKVISKFFVRTKKAANDDIVKATREAGAPYLSPASP